MAAIAAGDRETGCRADGDGCWYRHWSCHFSGAGCWFAMTTRANRWAAGWRGWARRWRCGTSRAGSRASWLPRRRRDRQASLTRTLTKADGWIDWTRPAADIERQIRAMWPWPRAWTTVHGSPVQIHGAQVVAVENGEYEPGDVISARRRLSWPAAKTRSRSRWSSRPGAGRWRRARISTGSSADRATRRCWGAGAQCRRWWSPSRADGKGKGAEELYLRISFLIRIYRYSNWPVGRSSRLGPGSGKRTDDDSGRKRRHGPSTLRCPSAGRDCC